jgi:hypothetical protein
MRGQIVTQRRVILRSQAEEAKGKGVRLKSNWQPASTMPTSPYVIIRTSWSTPIVAIEARQRIVFGDEENAPEYEWLWVFKTQEGTTDEKPS